VRDIGAPSYPARLTCRNEHLTQKVAEKRQSVRFRILVAVGMRITAHPPRRSRRAEFPHRAPVLGDSTVGFGVVATHPVPRCRRARAWDTRFRPSVRGVYPQPAVPLTRCLPSLPSAARRARRCSGRSLVLRTRPTSHDRASSATAPCLPDADQTACWPVVSHEISRFPHRERAHMPGSQTAQGRRAARDDATCRVAFRRLDGVGTPEQTFAAQWLAYAFPCQRFATPSRIVDT